MTEEENEPKAVLLHYLNNAHRSAVWKLEGLSEYDVRRPLTPTGTNLLGVVKHLAMVELSYFGEVFQRSPEVTVGWWAEEQQNFEVPNIDMFASAEQTRDEVLRLYDEAGRNTAATLAALDLDSPGRVPWWGDRGAVTLQRILVHMIDETARHTGQLDILREQLDGAADARPESDNLAELTGDEWVTYTAQLQQIAEQFRTPDPA